MDYRQKYYKYKNKYLKLKKDIKFESQMRKLKRSNNNEDIDEELIDEAKKQLLTMKRCYKKLNKMDDYEKLLGSVYPFHKNDYFLLKVSLCCCL